MQSGWGEVPRNAHIQGELHRLWAVERARRRGWIGLHQQAFHLESGGVRIGDVIGHDVELVAQGHLPRQANIEGVIHSILTRIVLMGEPDEDCKDWASLKVQ